MAIDLARLRRIYGRFHPEEPPAPSEYVDFNGLRGDTVIEPLAKEIGLADLSLTRLFSGGRGVGKTTELHRLEKIFKESGYTVVFMDADRAIDINNVDFPDVLVFMALTLIQELEEMRKLAPFANLVRTARDKLAEALRVINPDVEPSKAELSVGVAKFGFNLRQRRTGAESLREQAEALTTDMLQAFRELSGALNKAIESRGGAGLVLILDGTDKIEPRGADDETDQQERFFVQRAAQLCSLGAHLVLTAPISFCYSPTVAGFDQTAGGPPAVLPTISLRGPNRSEVREDTPGFQRFRELVGKRLATAGESVQDVFESETLERLIQASGGSPTMLMTLVRSALTRASDLPIGPDVADTAVRVEAQGFFRQLDDAHYDALRAYVQPNPARPKGEIGMDCLFRTYLYEYKDKEGARETWFEVNPIVRELAPLRG